MFRQIAACLALSGAVAAQVKVVPLVNLQALGGQTVFEGQATSFGANGSWVISPGIRLAEWASVLPVYSGTYRRTRDVRELVGGGFLTQEVLDQIWSLKPIFKAGSFRFKPRFSYKLEWTKESKDETLTTGLFNFWKLSGGYETEFSGGWGGRIRSLRLGVDGYKTVFPNYKSLASEARRPEIGEEIKSGDRILNFNAADPSFGVDLQPFQRTILSWQALVSLRHFPDQFLIQKSGTFSNERRDDLYFSSRFSWRQALKTGEKFSIVGGIDSDYNFLDSDQNSFDASRQFFTPDYYDYKEFLLAPQVGLEFRRRWGLSLGWEGSVRWYTGRVVQDSEGEFDKAGGKIILRASQLNFTVSYKVLPPHLTLVSRGAWRLQRSNMRFEQVYRYNYDSFVYFIGAAFEL